MEMIRKLARNKKVFGFENSGRVCYVCISLRYGPVAQLARALAWHARGRGFESR